ncbi:glycosyltransferase family 2 protein [Candidatus Dependentiae bacterium]|nr:glycosyltransferase family 2 protein [Candidatus Dependentiae bacterium]
MNKKGLVIFFYNFVFTSFLFLSIFIYPDSTESDFVTIAILAKDKAHTLPLFLKCIEAQTWLKKKIFLYIKTNNNNDNTVEILKDWIFKIKDLYAGIYFDDTDCSENIQQFGQHEWNSIRFKILGKIRNDSAVWAYKNNSHYFVVDCDNFIKPTTLENLMKLKLPIVAPFMIVHGRYYSNFHAAIDKNGYLVASDLAQMIYDQVIKGIIQVPVVHCTYLLRYECIPFITYDDNSYRYEYVIFSDVARRNNVTQYIDNRELYGFITFAENEQELQNEPWISKVESWLK